jgi:hypothetical protein
LGIDPLPDKGDYLISDGVLYERLQAEAKSKNAGAAKDAKKDEPDPAQEIISATRKKPWTRKQFPLVAEWLDSNEKPLALVVEGTQRPHRYDPLYCSSDDKGFLIGALLPGVQECRGLARILQTRAMLRLGEKQIDEAWGDLLSCHRLARLAAQGPGIIDALVGITIDGISFGSDRKLLQYASLNAEQLAKMRADLDQLAPMPSISEKIDLMERCIFLDTVSHLVKDGPAAMEKVLALSGGGPKPSGKDSASKKAASAFSSSIDWNRVLRDGNAWYDQIVAAWHKPTRAEQKEALEKMDADLKTATANTRRLLNAQGLSALDLSTLGTDDTSRMLLSQFSPAVSAAFNAESRWTMTFALDKLAFALAAYRADHGAYPAELALLTPQYVDTVPKDVFNDADLHYRQEDGGYLLYSVGRNGKDDGGRDEEDSEKNGNAENWDDIVVRISATKPR